MSGPKPQLIDRLRPFLTEKIEESPRSPASVASSVASSVPSVTSIASPDPRVEEAEDIVQSQRRQIEELERKLEASRQQLESMRRESAGAAASDQSRRLLQAHICVSQLRAQLDALTQPAPAPAPPPRYVLAASDATPDRLVRLFVSPSTNTDAPADQAPAKTNQYILNGVKVVPIAILPTHYEPERAAPPPPPPPPLPPPPPPSLPQIPVATLHDRTEDSQIMDDVLEILVENGELPPSAVVETPNPSLESYPDADAFSPADVLTDAQVRDSLGPDDLQRELDDIQNEIMSHADMHTVNDGDPVTGDIGSDLNVDLLMNDEIRDFGGSDPASVHDDFFRSLLSGDRDDRSQTAMDIGEDPPERMSMTPLTNGDILDHHRPGFDVMDDLSLPSFQNENSPHDTFGTFEERACEFDFRDLVSDLGSHMNVDSDGYDYMDTEIIPNHFGRGHVPQCDPLLGGVLSRPAPRPARKHYSWDKIEFDAT